MQAGKIFLFNIYPSFFFKKCSRIFITAFCIFYYKIILKKYSVYLKFAANVYYETPVDEAAAMAWYSQKLSTLKSAGADYFAVMGYFEQTHLYILKKLSCHYIPLCF